MKKIVLLVFMGLCLSSFTSFDGKVKKGQLMDAEVAFIKKTYKWDTEAFLIVSFRQPRIRCHYDNYKNISKSNRAIGRLISKIEEKDVKVISVSSDKKTVKHLIDEEDTFYDTYDFFINRFFYYESSCYALVVINQNGNFISKVGEFTDRHINTFITELN